MRKIVKAEDLRAEVRDDREPSSSLAVLRKNITAPDDARLAWRRQFGRALSMDAIFSAWLAAQRGAMQDITDLSRETIDSDPHLASVLQKRFGSVSSLPYQIDPAFGPGIDKDRAHHFAAIVRDQIRSLNGFRQNLSQIAWGIFDGRSAQEMKWRATIGSVSSPYGRVSLELQSIDWIHPRRLSFGPKREIRITNDSTAVSGNFAPIGISLDPDDLKSEKLWRKFISWTPQLFSEYPEREGLATRCLYWSFFKRFAMRDEMILLELFGKPWRIIKVDDESEASEEDLLAADDIVDALGASYTARLPRGTDLDVIQPGQTAGQVHQAVIKEADQQISKLVLGQTGTTDGTTAGFNSNQASVMQDEQMMILSRDASAISEIVENQIVDAIIELNFGENWLSHSPTFTLRADLPLDRSSEIDRVQKALDAGLVLAREEVYEVAGFRIPEPEEISIKIEQPPTPPLSPVAPAPRPLIVYPPGDVPGRQEQQESPVTPPSEENQGHGAQVGSGDVAAIITVNEARASEGLPPLALPDGSPDPSGDMTIEEYRSKLSTSGEVSDQADEAVAMARAGIGEFACLLHNDGFDGAENFIRYVSEVNGVDSECFVCLTAVEHEQPVTPFGSPDSLIVKGKKEMFRTADQWADKIADEIGDAKTLQEISGAISRAGEKLDTFAFARATERRMIQAAALGALDVALEIGDIDAPRTNASNDRHGVLLDFSTRPFNDAIKSFRSRGIMTRAQWDLMTAEIKRKSFTVAGIESRRMLKKVMMILAVEVRGGADLRGFKARMFDALKTAGLISSVQKTGLLGAAHVETVYRTNVLNAYSFGREKFASQPDVVKRFPVWEIRSIQDPRARETHRSVNGVRLMANDPFFKTAYPPFGFNCRCRVVSLPAADSLTVTSGATITGLPDPGFVSGTNKMI